MDKQEFLSMMSEKKEFLEKKAEDKVDNHWIVVGWNQRTKRIIQEIHQIQPNLNITLIDETLDESPFSFDTFSFVKGDPSVDNVLLKGSVKTAQTVLISSDQHETEHQADMKSILILVTVKGLNPNIHSIVEVRTSEQMSNAKHAGADEIIDSNTFASQVMLHRIQSKQPSPSLLTLLNKSDGNRITFMPVPAKCLNQTMDKCIEVMRTERIIPIGVKHKGELKFFPFHNSLVIKGDELLVIANDK